MSKVLLAAFVLFYVGITKLAQVVVSLFVIAFVGLTTYEMVKMYRKAQKGQVHAASSF